MSRLEIVGWVFVAAGLLVLNAGAWRMIGYMEQAERCAALDGAFND